MMPRSALALTIGTSLIGLLGCNSPDNPPSDPTSGNSMLQNQPPTHVKPPDFATAAQKLGVKEADLVKALGLPEKPPTGQAGTTPPPPPRLDVKGAATKLGVSEQKLVEALNLPKPSQGDRLPPDSLPPS
jgi:hypothetical protein